MGQSDPENENCHKRQSMILVPKNTPGVKLVRYVTNFGYDDALFGEPELLFENVGFQQKICCWVKGAVLRLLRTAGAGPDPSLHAPCWGAQRAFELMLERVEKRTTFGRPLGSINRCVRILPAPGQRLNRPAC